MSETKDKNVNQSRVIKPLFVPDEIVDVKVSNLAPRKPNRFLVPIGHFGLRCLGWKFRGEFVDKKKMIVIVAPHSSNWDWVIGVCAIWVMQIKFSYLIKGSLFFWPLSILLKNTGAIGIDRENAQGIVGQVIEKFNTSDQLYFAITPEGTRKKVKKWKSGFLRVAYDAGVPVVPASLNYKNKRVLIDKPFKLVGDIDIDMKMIRTYFDEFPQKH